jgi:hypothetical protein
MLVRRSGSAGQSPPGFTLRAVPQPQTRISLIAQIHTEPSPHSASSARLREICAFRGMQLAAAQRAIEARRATTPITGVEKPTRISLIAQIHTEPSPHSARSARLREICAFRGMQLTAAQRAIEARRATTPITGVEKQTRISLIAQIRTEPSPHSASSARIRGIRAFRAMQLTAAQRAIEARRATTPINAVESKHGFH